MQPLQDDLRDPAAKDNSITNAATARSNLDAAITMRSAETELQNTIELRATASEIVAPKPDGSRRQSEKKTILKHFLKGFLEGKSLAPKWRKSANKSMLQPSCSHSNTIYEIQLQKTIVLPMQPKHEATLTQPLQCDLQRLSCKPQSHLHCGNDPTVANHNGIPSATHPPATLAIPFTLRERSYSCKSQWNSIGNSSTSTTCNPIYIAGTILQLQITMEFCRPHMHETQVKPHLQCGTDPNMIRPWSAHDPTTHETVSQPSHRRGRSSRFGDGLCMEKHRVSCICYLSKTYFVRDFLQNSIGNSSTSTTCNAICIAGTILQLQITMEFHRQLIHQHHLQSHLHCGNDPTVANHNGILSTAHARNTGDTPFTPIRTWSAHDPPMIRPHTRPSRNRRTAEVDHRGSGTDFVWKNIGFRASAISQKRISCETSFKNPTWRCHLQLILSLTHSFFD